MSSNKKVSLYATGELRCPGCFSTDLTTQSASMNIKGFGGVRVGLLSSADIGFQCRSCSSENYLELLDDGKSVRMTWSD